MRSRPIRREDIFHTAQDLERSVTRGMGLLLMASQGICSIDLQFYSVSIDSLESKAIFGYDFTLGSFTWIQELDAEPKAECNK